MRFQAQDIVLSLVHPDLQSMPLTDFGGYLGVGAG
jgi:hypothetical protein